MVHGSPAIHDLQLTFSDPPDGSRLLLLSSLNLPKKVLVALSSPRGLSWAFFPFQRHQLCEPGCGDLSLCLPEFASPSFFPSRSFSLPQGFTSHIPLQPSFILLPLIGFYTLELYAFSPSPGGDVLPLGVASRPVCAFEHRSGLQVLRTRRSFALFPPLLSCCRITKIHLWTTPVFPRLPPSGAWPGLRPWLSVLRPCHRCPWPTTRVVCS